MDQVYLNVFWVAPLMLGIIAYLITNDSEYGMRVMIKSFVFLVKAAIVLFTCGLALVFAAGQQATK